MTATNHQKETNYYPFGLAQKGYNNLTTSLGSAGAKKYQYNGKELQDDYGLDWYDYGARFYDVGLGRFFTIDPLAKKYVFQSLYVYAANDPIRFIDENGKGPLDNLITNFVIYLVTKTAPSFNNFWNKEASYMSQTYDINGNYHSGNAYSAATHGMTANKIITDFSETVKPITDNIDVTMSLGKEVYVTKNIKIGIEGEYGFLSGDKNLSASLPYDIAGMNVSADKDNNMKVSGTVLNQSTTIAGSNNSKEYDNKISIPLGPANINVKANFAKMKQQLSSPEYKKTMKEVKNSYKGGGKELEWKDLNN